MKRILSICLALILLISCLPMTAMAADPTSGVVVGGKLRLRANPSTDATIITAYPTGTALTITSVYNSSWYAVTGPDGYKGYVMSKFVNTSSSGSSTGTGLYEATVVSANGKGVRMRIGPSTTYGVLKVYPVGTKVTVLSHGKYWDRIRVGLHTGYMMNQFLYTGSNPDPTDSYYATVYASNGYGVRLRSYPSTSATILGLYSVGTRVLVLKHDTYWDYIRIGTREGYMMNQFLVTSGNVTGVTVTPKTVSIDKGDSAAFSATVNGTGYYNNGVTWTISTHTSASTVISAAGVLTVGSDETVTSLSVTATSKYNTTRSDSATVTITTPTPKPTVTDVVVTADCGATSVVKGTSQQFKATVQGENSPAQTVTWKLSGTYDIGTSIDANGKLTVSASETKTTVTVMATSTADPAKNGTTTIAVVDKAVASIAIKAQPTKLSYTEGETLDLSGLVVTLTYADATTKDVALGDFGTNKLTVSPANGAPLSVAHSGKPAIVTYNSDSSKTASTSNLTVAAKTVASIAVSTAPVKLSYFEGQKFDPAGLKLLVTYSDGTTTFVDYSSVTAAAFTLTPSTATALVPADNKITIGYAGKTVDQPITVTALEVVGIEVLSQPTKLRYEISQTLDLTGLVVKLSYNDGTSANASLADFATYSLSANPANGAVLASSNNGAPVIITYGSTSKVCATDNLAVVNVNGIAVKYDPTKMNYIEGEHLELAGLEVTVSYSDATSKDVALSEFAAYSLTTSMSNGDALTAAQNGTPITVSYNGGAYTATTSNLTVTAKQVTSISVATQPTTSYVSGAQLDLSGMVVTMNYNNGDVENVPYASFGAKLLAASPDHATSLTTAHNGTSVVITYNSDPSITASTNALSVVDRAVTSISINAQPKLNYYDGDTLVLDAMKVTVNYNDTTTETVDYSDFATHSLTASMANGAALSTTDNGTITVTHTPTGQTAVTNALNVSAVTIQSIEVDISSTAKTGYTVGETFDPTGLVLKTNMNNGTSSTVAYDMANATDFTFTPSLTTALAQTDMSVMIEYTMPTLSYSLSITVTPAP